MSVYGDKTQRNEASGPCGVVAGLTTSMAGNVILRAGRINSDESWSQSEHVVLTPGEALELSRELALLAELGKMSQAQVS